MQSASSKPLNNTTSSVDEKSEVHELNRAENGTCEKLSLSKIINIAFISTLYEDILLGLSKLKGVCIFGSCVHLLWAILTGASERPHVIVMNNIGGLSFRDIDIMVGTGFVTSVTNFLKKLGFILERTGGKYAHLPSKDIYQKRTYTCYFSQMAGHASAILHDFVSSAVSDAFKKCGYDGPISGLFFKIDLIVVHHLIGKSKDSPSQIISAGMYPPTMSRNFAMCVKYGSPHIFTISDTILTDASSFNDMLVSSIIATLSADIRRQFGNETVAGDRLLPDCQSTLKALSKETNLFTMYSKFLGCGVDPVLRKQLQLKSLSPIDFLKSNPDNHDDCSICLDPLISPVKPVTILSCGHAFHSVCFAKPLLDLFKAIYSSLQNGREILKNEFDHYGHPTERIHMTSCPNCRNDFGLSDLEKYIMVPETDTLNADWKFTDKKALSRLFTNK